MSKLIDEPVLVRSGPDTNCPRSFVWRGRHYRISHLGTRWHRTGKWWEGDGEKVYVRAVASNGGAYDLCYDPESDQWRLHVVHD